MEINFLAVGVATLVVFFVRFLWYMVIFQKPWQEEIGMKTKGKSSAKADQTPNLLPLLIGSFILEAIMAINLAAFIGKDAAWDFGLFAGLAAGLGWVALAFGVNYMFEGRSFKLWLINAGYNIVALAIMGLIIGAF
jgi:hypothetical protein